MRIKAFDFLLVCVSVVGTVLFLEMAVRICVPVSSEETLLTRYDAVLGWSLRPGVEGHNKTSEYQTVERINAKGLRGPEYPYTKPHGIRRILVLGDSFTEGYAVNEPDLFTTRLAELLNHGISSTEVINMGVAGYSTDQELLYFDVEGKKYSPDTTILMFYYNDVWFNNQSWYWRGCKPRFTPKGNGLSLVPIDNDVCQRQTPKGHFRLLALIKELVGRNDVLTRLFIRLHLKKVPEEFAPWRKIPTDQTEQAWRITALLLAQFKQDTQRAGSTFLVFYVPSSSEIDENIYRTTMRHWGFDSTQWDPGETKRRLKALCDAQGITLIDPVPAFKSLGGSLYYSWDGHWNVRGNAAAAAVLAGALNHL